MNNNPRKRKNDLDQELKKTKILKDMSIKKKKKKKYKKIIQLKKKKKDGLKKYLLIKKKIQMKIIKN